MRHLITSALPYINGIKHLGNLAGSMLPADVYARFLRSEGEEVLFICGTDEHGAPAELAAAEAGQDVASYTADQYRLQSAIYEGFGLSFDHFGRSSSPENHQLTRRIFRELQDNGYIYRKMLKQVYSPSDGRYLPDRYIIGSCPFCGYDRARGDQCENCTRLLDPLDLIDPRSAISGSRELEVRETEHLFLRLEDLQPRLEGWVEKSHERWPSLTRQIAMGWLREGLRDRCITRDLKWGVQVPEPDFHDKVFYVWFDAPISYIGSTWEWAKKVHQPEAWKSWWLETDDVDYTQFMGKDNLPFHAIMFPAMMIGACPKWKMADQIKGLHWLDYYGGKFSTSAKRGVFTDVALELYPADYWRYCLMALIPETSDSTFTWERFAETVNKDLADTLGNFVNRVLRFCTSRFGARIPDGGIAGPHEEQVWAAASAHVERYRTNMHSLEFRSSMRELRALWVLGNVYMHERKPWVAIKDNRSEAALTIRMCFNLIRLFAAAAEPVVPSLTAAIQDALQLAPEERRVPLAAIGPDGLAGGRPFTGIPPLVKRIEEDEVMRLRDRFVGQE